MRSCRSRTSSPVAYVVAPASCRDLFPRHGAEALTDQVDDGGGGHLHAVHRRVNRELGRWGELVLDVDAGDPGTRPRRPRIDSGWRRSTGPDRFTLATDLQR